MYHQSPRLVVYHDSNVVSGYEIPSMLDETLPARPRSARVYNILPWGGANRFIRDFKRTARLLPVISTISPCTGGQGFRVIGSAVTSGADAQDGRPWNIPYPHAVVQGAHICADTSWKTSDRYSRVSET